MTPAIALHNVRKSFGDKVAVEDLTLEIPAGCIYGFLGPNGAGKTTTLRTIVGISTLTRAASAFSGSAIRPRSGSASATCLKSAESTTGCVSST